MQCLHCIPHAVLKMPTCGQNAARAWSDCRGDVMSCMFWQHYWQWVKDCPCTVPGQAWEHPGLGKQEGCDTLSPSADATRAHLPEPRVSAGSELTVLSEQRETLLLRLALWCRQMPAAVCLSPGCNVCVGQAWQISHSGCLHHMVHPGAVVLLS